MIGVESFFDELEKIAAGAEPRKKGVLYTDVQMKMLNDYHGNNWPEDDDEEERAIEELRKDPKWRLEEEISSTGTVPVMGGLATGAIGGAIGGFKAGRRIGMPIVGGMLGMYGGSILGAKGGLAIREKMLAKKRNDLTWLRSRSHQS